MSVMAGSIAKPGQAEAPRPSALRRVCFRAFHLAAVCLLLWRASSACGQASFTASLDRDAITVGESATLTLRFVGGQPANFDPQSVPGALSPSVPGLRFGPVSQGTEFSIVNGQSSSSITFSYPMTAVKEGEYVIPPISLRVGNQTLTSQALKLRVVPPSQAEQEALNRLAFLRLIVPEKKEFYLGEMFPVEVQLYVQNGEDLEMPQFKTDGFTLGKHLRPDQKRVQVGNLVYTLVSFKYSVVAARTGALQLGPVECKLTLNISNPRRRGDPFDPFGLFGQRYEKKPVVLTSEAHPVNILPLPGDNVPPAFRGAVGAFTLQVAASPTNLAVGDPITLVVKVSGRGTLDQIALPPFDDWREFKVYPANTKVESSDPLGLEGVKIFEQVVIPQNAEVKELPSISFSYFDPERRAYQTLTHAPVKLVVRPVAGGPQQPVVLAGAAAATPAPQQDIVHIKTRLGELGVVGPPLLERPWFLALQGVPVLLWAGALVMRRRHERLAGDPRLRRKRRVAGVVREGLAELRRLAAANQSEAFHATVFRLLQEQIGERLDLPASAITESVVDERLLPRGLSDDAAGQLHDLFQQCNQARYAPGATTAELTALVPRVEAALAAVRQIAD
jgi:hypothetical protein